MRVSPALAILLVLPVVLAGCLGDTEAPPPAAAPGSLAEALAASPAPGVDGAVVDAWLADFVGAFKPRVTGTPSEAAAADALAGELSALGLEVTVHRYDALGNPDANGPVRVVAALKPGTDGADHWILMGGHYDTSVLLSGGLGPAPVGPGLTLEAAYDNGSGTALVVALARALAGLESNKTLGFLLFAGEEEGLLGSEAYVKALPPEVTVDAYLGFDMIGINYPSPAACLCLYSGSASAEPFVPLLREVAFGFLRYPDDGASVQVHDNHDTRNSDERSFAVAGIPTMRWAGGESARAYPGYHQLNDTMETVYATAGSQELFQQGMTAAVASAYYTVLALDRTAVAR